MTNATTRARDIDQFLNSLEQIDASRNYLVMAKKEKRARRLSQKRLWRDRAVTLVMFAAVGCIMLVA